MNLYRVDFYAKDWLLDTQRLTLEERGVFIQIVASIYQHGGPIDNDTRWLGSLCNCSPRKVATIIQALLGKNFIEIEDGKITQKRAIKELETARKRSENAAKNARKLHEKRSKTSRKTVENEPVLSDNKDLTPANKQLTINKQEKKHTKKDFEFELFWKEYPLKKAKIDAEKAYWKARDGTEAEILLKAARRYAAETKGREKKYIAHPATWLNRGSYLDEPDERDPEPMTEWPAWKKQLAARIGDHNIKGWFGNAYMNGGKIAVTKAFQKTKIENEFMNDIEFVFGKRYDIVLTEAK